MSNNGNNGNGNGNNGNGNGNNGNGNGNGNNGNNGNGNGYGHLFKYLPTAFLDSFTILEQMKALYKALQMINLDTEKIMTDLAAKEDVLNLTNIRKLSPDGNFTGLLDGRPILQYKSDILDNRNAINYLTGQFSDGLTGLVVNGGYFENGEVIKQYDGGVF